MDKLSSHKSLKELQNESSQIRRKYPGRIPVIVTVNNEWFKSSLPKLDKNKFLVPIDLTMGQFMYIIRKRLKLDSSKAIFLYTNNNITPATSELIGTLDTKYCDDTGVLKFNLCSESTFG